MRPKEIKKLIELVEDSSINELEVSRFGKKVRILKQQGGTAVIASAPGSVNTQPVEPNYIPTQAQAQPVVAEDVAGKPSENSNIVEIKSPMVGTYYQAPSPDADPYVQEGDIIKANQVLCIVEAMKLMNEIESEMRGRIVEILCENGKPVEYDQVLFRLEKL